ncbi:hypothetical protein CV102_15075 [Natronococcus pandeyae]|uniref:Uncharacterized protein n=1 Tax=Natronococcus pandeyae TaxID=2055836 RepID=A0A8J8TR72_9EURY|nr:hypothetical protein [Natronococcus pandeyae]TYL37660.1 hypothetical protein CV102_15075 [Natronococcus pandeyae]
MTRRPFLAALFVALAGCGTVRRSPDRRPDAPEVKAVVSADHDAEADVVRFTVRRSTGLRPNLVDEVYVETPDGDRQVWVTAEDGNGDEPLVEDGASFVVDVGRKGRYALAVDQSDDELARVVLEHVEVEP